MVLTYEFVNEILKCYHSNKTLEHRLLVLLFVLHSTYYKAKFMTADVFLEVFMKIRTAILFQFLGWFNFRPRERFGNINFCTE